jgi:hypothetical protein
MMWGQQIKVYTDHRNLIKDALGLTSDWIYQWRLLPEEYGLEIIHIIGINNTVTDAVLHLDYCPVQNNRETRMTFTQCWCYYASHTTTQQSAHQASMNFVFANRSEEDIVNPSQSRRLQRQRLRKLTPMSAHWRVFPSTPDNWWKTQQYFAKVQPWSFLLPLGIEQ